MKREEILEKSRNENLSADPYTAEVEKKAAQIGNWTGIVITFVLLAIEGLLLKKGANYGYCLIIFSVLAMQSIYRAAKLKTKHHLAFAIFQSILAVFAAVVVILKYMG